MRVRPALRLLLLTGALGWWLASTEIVRAEPLSPEVTAPADLPEAASEDAFDDDDDWLFGPDDGPDPAERDPMETFNRGVFRLNEGVYKWIVDPLSRAYEWAMPAPARRAVTRGFRNLDEPVIFLNDVLQLAPRDASESLGRFLINSTVGLAGLFDPASRLGMPGHHTDFGETLAVYSTPSGPYFVIPVLGPATIRDAVGAAVDGLLSPDLWVLASTSTVALNTGNGFTSYDIERERLDALRQTSVDFYAAMRSAYLLDRDAGVAKRLLRVSGDPEAATTDPGRLPPEAVPGSSRPDSLPGG